MKRFDAQTEATDAAAQLGIEATDAAAQRCIQATDAAAQRGIQATDAAAQRCIEATDAAASCERSRASRGNNSVRGAGSNPCVPSCPAHLSALHLSARRLLKKRCATIQALLGIASMADEEQR